MSRYADRIQGTDRLLRIRRIRKAVFAGIIALTLVLIFARLDAEGAGIKPLFLPVNGIIEICLIMGFVSAIIGLFLRHLEIKNAPRDGQRYLMAKSSMARAIRTAGFAIGLAVVLLLAVTPSLAATLFSDAPQVVQIDPRNREVVTFTSPDPLGVSFVTHATAAVASGRPRVTLARNGVDVPSGDPAATPSPPPPLWSPRMPAPGIRWPPLPFPLPLLRSRPAPPRPRPRNRLRPLRGPWPGSPRRPRALRRRPRVSPPQGTTRTPWRPTSRRWTSTGTISPRSSGWAHASRVSIGSRRPSKCTKGSYGTT